MKTEEIVCGQCGQSVAVAADHLGQEVQCPHCQHVVQAPDPVPAPPPAPAALDFNAAPTAPPARTQSRGSWASLLLVFFIPYAIVATGVIAYLVWNQHRDQAHPLEWLLDQQPEDGGPKQIKHDLPLLDRQKTPLGKSIQIGDAVELTPVNVELAPKGDWVVLTLRLRNLTKDQRFNPLPRSFLVRDKGYTFLEFGKHRIYGGHLAYRKAVRFWDYLLQPAPPVFDGVLNPGEEMMVTLTTAPRDEPLVRRLTDHRGPMLWRLEVRRGLVEVAGKAISATAVIGVEFDVGVLLHDQREWACTNSASVTGFFALPARL